MNTASTKCPSVRLVNPGRAFCSWIAVGLRISQATRSTGPLEYPPTPITTSGSNFRRTFIDCQKARGRRNRPMRNPSRPIRLSGPTSMISSGYPAFGTSRASIPRADPTNSTSLRGWRVFTSSPSASPGKRWPPVPPPATRSQVGVRRGKEEQLLVAFSQSDAERAAGPERQERLHGLVAVSPRILPGIEEGEDALDAVRRLPDQDRQDRRSRAGHREKMVEPGAGGEQQRERDAAEDGGRSEVRLEHQEQSEDRQHREMRQDPHREETDAVLLLRQRAREPEYQRDLRQLAGLAGQRADP